MAEISFQDIRFFDEGKEDIKALFLRHYYFYIPKEELSRVGKFEVKDGAISIDCSQAKADKKFMFILEKGFLELKNVFNDKPTVYIHRNSGIPLIGSGSFGIIDRGTNLIEIKPSTGCNIDCIYCSVAEEKRASDFVVEAGYLVDELKKIINFKGDGKYEVHIGCQGEPLLYASLSELIRGVSGISGVKVVSMDTNGTMITKKIADELIEAGLTRFNVSINALDPEICKRIAGDNYDISKVLDICRYVSKKADIIITPVLIPGINEQEMEKIVDFAVDINPKSLTPIGIQNFLEYKQGRNPVKQWEMDEFMEFLKGIEERKGVKLVFGPEDFNITKTLQLPKVFKKGETADIEIKARGRFPKEQIGVAKERGVTVSGCSFDKKNVKVKITRTKHNIYYGVCL